MCTEQLSGEPCAHDPLERWALGVPHGRAPQVDYHKTSRKRFFIIDGYALLFRAHFALIRNPLITSYGLNTSALFGFINQLLKIIKDERSSSRD